MRLHGARMLDAGYHIVPIVPGKKNPGEYANGKWFPMAGWSKFAHMKPPEQLIDIWSNWPGAGIGVVTGGASGIIGVDIDILDDALANQIKMVFFDKLGATPLIRVGRAPKMMLVYRVEGVMTKISLAPLEVLATGQQFVAYGIHPDTGLEYKWVVESPPDTLMTNIPLVTSTAVQEAAQEAYKLIPEELKQGRLADGGGHVGGGDSAPATIEAITETLNIIPNDNVQWDDWKRILMAVFVSSRGSEQAYFEFLKWSRKSGKHTDNTTRHEWNGCRVSVPNRINFGTLHYIASKYGWTPSPELKFNEDKKAASSTDVSGFDAMPVVQKPRVQPVEQVHAPRTRINDIIAAQPQRREEILQSVGVGMRTVVDGDGVVTELLYPMHEIGQQSSEEYVKNQLQTIYEDSKNLFCTDEPKKLRLTQDEIENGTMPRIFADAFPQEWLFSRSLIGRMAHWIDTSCIYSHRVFALMAAMTAFGAIVGRQYQTQSGLRPSLSICNIAPTGSGKQGPRAAVNRLLHAADGARYIGPMGGYSSGSGVVEGLMNQPCMWLDIDEFGKKIAAYGNKGDQNQREMIAMYLEAVANEYIGGKGYANSKENATKNVKIPNLNICGWSQIEEITGALSSAASNDGFIQRFLFVPTFADYPPMREDFRRPPVPEDLINDLKYIMEHLATLGGDFATNDDANAEPNMITVEMTKQAKEMFYALDTRKRKMLADHRRMWVRSASHIVKVAMLEAIATNPLEPVVTAEGMDSARRLVDWFMQYAETYIASRIADNDVERDLKKIKMFIADGGVEGVQRWALNRKVQTMLPRTRDEMIKSLIESQEVEEIVVPDPVAGRRPKRILRFVQT